ncbi:MAG: hypothetical protein ACJAWL_003248, partial [Motiliproteus sp.]
LGLIFTHLERRYRDDFLWHRGKLFRSLLADIHAVFVFSHSLCLSEPLSHAKSPVPSPRQAEA